MDFKHTMKYLSLFLIIFTIAACSSTEQTVQDAVEEIKENYKENNTAAGTSDNIFESLRTQLSDAYAYRENEIPEAFTQVKVEQEEEKDLYEGYRIQIYSGQNVADADTIAASFKAWADTTIVGYQPEAYVFFKTPYYRVHVGDFHERDRAISFSNIVKRYFRDAWVVYDKVNPFYVPADTTVIETK